MAGYTINDLKKAGSLSGQDAIPVQQNGITRQFEVGIMDNASLVKQSGSQSSGVIRKAQTFVLQSATKINFTLENAVGRIVTDNEYVDNAEAASGWKVYVVNISSIEHTVIHGANSWPVPAGEILCFYWTGSRFTLHNIVINNLTVRGDTKLLNISAVQALTAANKIPVIGTDGKLASTTAQAIVDLANVDGKINNALTNYDTKGNQSIIAKTDANLCIPNEQTESINYIAYGSNKNLPTTSASYFIRTQRSTSYIIQFASNVQNDLAKTEPDYIRKAKLSGETWTFSPWEKVTTESNLFTYTKIPNFAPQETQNITISEKGVYTISVCLENTAYRLVYTAFRTSFNLNIAEHFKNGLTLEWVNATTLKLTNTTSNTLSCYINIAKIGKCD